MDQEQAFLRAIRRRPGASAPRLVYADWLTDRGDPRGEFIHCQVRTRRLPKDCPRRLDLEARAHDLLLAHEADWLGPLLGAVYNWEWRDGLLDWVTVGADVFLANAERWLPALPLLGVHLRKAHDHVAALARCEQLAHLSGLYLGDNKLTDDDLDVLLGSPHLKNVRSLYLHSNVFGTRGVLTLARTPNLPRLRALALGKNHIDDEAVAALASSRRLNRLRVLLLQMCLSGEGRIRGLVGSPLLARLRDLALSLNILPPGSLAALVGDPAFAGVRFLGYEMNQPDDADVAALAASPHAAELRHLSLSTYLAFGDAGLTALASSPFLGRLRSLNLGSGAWGPAGVRALGRSRTLTALRSLDLTPSGERIGAVTKVLLRQPLVRRLRRLNLRVHRISKEDLAALASHPRPLRLHELSLPLSSDMVAGWESLLSRGLLAGLTDLTLSESPPGCVRALLEPGRLPELRKLTLGGLSDLDELQALLDSPLLARLHELRVGLDQETEDKKSVEVVRRLCAAWHTPALRDLGLLWSLSTKSVRLLAEATPPPALTRLDLGVFRMKAEGMAALAGSPLLDQLRHLVLSNASAQAVPGLKALAESPHVGPLLRVDIHNGHVPREAVAAVRRRFGGRFGVSGRAYPRTVSVTDWSSLFGDGED